LDVHRDQNVDNLYLSQKKVSWEGI
jgi:hypothetical protein